MLKFIRWMFHISLFISFCLGYAQAEEYPILPEFIDRVEELQAPEVQSQVIDACLPELPEIKKELAKFMLQRPKQRTSRALKANSEWINSVRFSPDGNTLAAAAYVNGDIALWNSQTGDRLQKLETGDVLRCHNKHMPSVSFTQDGSLLASGTDITDQSKLRKQCSFFCNPDGEILSAVVDYNKPIKLKSTLNTETKQLCHSESMTSLCFSPNGKILASGSRSFIRLWDTQTGEILTELRDPLNTTVGSLCFSPDGNLLASGGFMPLEGPGEATVLWDIQTGKPLRKLKEEFGNVTALAFSPDGQILASGTNGATTITLWDIQNGNKLLEMCHNDGKPSYHNYQPANRSCYSYGRITSICFSPDGRTLVSGTTQSKSIRMWNLYDKEDQEVLDLLMNPIHGSGLTPAQKVLLYVLNGMKTNAEKDLQEEYIDKKPSIKPAINLKAVNHALNAKYEDQRKDRPALLKLEDSYNSLPDDLRNLVKEYFNVIEEDQVDATEEQDQEDKMQCE